MFKKLSKYKPLVYLISRLIIIYLYIIKYLCKQKIIYSGNSHDILCNNKPVILVCWHSRFMPLLTIKEIGNFYAVTSSHKDGNFLQEILIYYGHKAIRGSSRKNATNAMREILKINANALRLVITPDGPIGPRFKLKGNLIRIANRFKVPIIPVTFSASNAIVLNTWDRFLLPIPLISKIFVHMAAPINVNASLTNSKLENIMIKITKKIDKECNVKIDY